MNSLKFREGENPEEDEFRVSFSTDGKGRWWRTDWQRQCPEGVFLQGRCQGVEGHKGVHWRYDASGSFCYDDNEQDSSEFGCSGTIPPDHKHYRTPLEMEKRLFRKFKSMVEVTDPEEVARLERNEINDNESVIRPLREDGVSPEKWAELKRQSEEMKAQKPKPEHWLKRLIWPRSGKPKVD